MVKVSKCVINRYYKSPSQRTYCLAVKYDFKVHHNFYAERL